MAVVADFVAAVVAIVGEEVLGCVTSAVLGSDVTGPTTRSIDAISTAAINMKSTHGLSAYLSYNT